MGRHSYNLWNILQTYVAHWQRDSHVIKLKIRYAYLLKWNNSSLEWHNFPRETRSVNSDSLPSVTSFTKREVPNFFSTYPDIKYNALISSSEALPSVEAMHMSRRSKSESSMSILQQLDSFTWRSMVILSSLCISAKRRSRKLQSTSSAEI